MDSGMRIEQGGKHKSVQGKMGLLFLAHDLLPWEDEEQGLTAAEIGQGLARFGIVMNSRALVRLFDDLMNMAFVDYEDERPRRFRRMYRHRLTDAMPGGIPLPRGRIAEVPNWKSDILLRP